MSVLTQLRELRNECLVTIQVVDNGKLGQMMNRMREDHDISESEMACALKMKIHDYQNCEDGIGHFNLKQQLNFIRHINLARLGDDRCNNPEASTL